MDEESGTKKFQDARTMIEKLLKELKNCKSLDDIRSVKARLVPGCQNDDREAAQGAQKLQKLG